MNRIMGRWLKVGVLMLVAAVVFAACEGAAGIKGAVGPKGEPGAEGPAGPAGVAGPAGPPGADGERGPEGPAGPRGEQGPEGPPGMPGPTGNVGPSPKGDLMYMGVVNDDGSNLGGPLELDMSPFFFDPNGDTLTYTVRWDEYDTPATDDTDTAVIKTAESTDTGVEVTLDSGAVHADYATVTVRATDPEMLWAEQSFKVRRNRKPRIANAFTPQTASESMGTSGAHLKHVYTVGIGVVEASPANTIHFQDDIGMGLDKLTISVSSDDPNVADVTVEDTKVTVTGKASGTASITIRAEDTGGLVASHSVAIAVNGAPVFDKDLPDIVAGVGQKAATLEKLLDYVSDPETADSDLGIEAASLDADVATCSYAAGTVTVTRTTTVAGTVAGRTVSVACEVTVTEEAASVGAHPGAGNHLGQTAKQSFTVTFPSGS